MWLESLNIYSIVVKQIWYDYSSTLHTVMLFTPESKHIESVLCTMIKLKIYVHVHATEKHKTIQNIISC